MKILNVKSIKFIQRIIIQKTDEFSIENILSKFRFSSEEYLDFRTFFKNLKDCFKDTEWSSDKHCKAIEAIFEGSKLPGTVFITIQDLYKNN